MTTYADRPWLQYYDPGMPATLEPYPDMAVQDFMTQAAQHNPDHPALMMSAKVPVIGRRQTTFTYGQLDHAADALACALLDLGLQKGERVALVLPNIIQFPIAFYAVLKAGGIVAATNPTYPENRMQHQINDSDAKIIITLSLFYDMLKRVQPHTQVQHIITTNVKEYLPQPAKTLFSLFKEKKDGHTVPKPLPTGDVQFQALLQQYAGQQPPPVKTEPHDVALFQYTGGTTGVSKGAMLTHRNIVANSLQIKSLWTNVLRDDQKPQDQLFAGVLPMFHAAGLVAVLMQTVTTQATCVLVPNPRDIDELVDIIDVYQPNILGSVPALYNAINRHPRVASGDASLKSIQFSISGTAPLSPITKRTYEQLSGNVISEGYGLSECLVTHGNPFINPRKDNSVGFPLPDVEVRIVDLDTGREAVPIGEVGEIILRGPMMMKGYHNQAQETAQTLRDYEGKIWCYTGDIGRMDEQGYFFIVDRKKDMAIIGGYNVYPTTVENVLMEHPAVQDVGVATIAHPEKVGQEAIKAWIIVRSDASLTEAELIAHCEQYLAQYEVPRRFAFVTEIPKTTVGKTLRRALVQMELDELT